MSQYEGKCSSCGSDAKGFSYETGTCCYARACEKITQLERKLTKIENWVDNSGPLQNGSNMVDAIKGNYSELKKLVT